MQQLDTETISGLPADCAALVLEVVPLVMRRIRNEMRERTHLGVSVPQFRALNYLGRHPGASLSELAEFLGLTPPSTSKLVQKLVTERVVARRSGRDRRRVSLKLTPHGQEVLETARAETRQQLAERLRSLPERDLAKLSASLRRLASAFSGS